MRYANLYFIPSFLMPAMLGLISGIFAFLSLRATASDTMEGTLFLVCAAGSVLLLGFIFTHYHLMMSRVSKLEAKQHALAKATPSQDLSQYSYSPKTDILGLDPFEIEIKKSLNESNLTNVVQLHDEADKQIKKNNKIIINLQAVIEMKGRSVHAYEVLARMESHNGIYKSATEIFEGFKKNSEFHYLDKTILEQTVEVLQCLDEGSDLLMHINISKQTLESKAAFAKYYTILKSNVGICNNLVLEISQQQFSELSGASHNRLLSIVDMGFKLSIDNCTNYCALSNLIEKKAVAVIKTPVTKFIEINDHNKERKIRSLMQACKDQDVPFIVTHVDEGYQLQELIRFNVLFAQGFLFSAPKRPKSKQH